MYYNLIRKLSLVLTAWLFGVMPLVNVAFAQPAGWEDITPEGWTGDFLHIAKMSDGRLLTAASNGWIYESSDTAQSWHLLYKMPDKPQESYAKFCMYEGEKGYLETHKFVLYTDDSGHTWEVADVPEPVAGFSGEKSDRHYLMYYKTNDTLFFCTSTYRGTDVFMSGDGGKAWKLVIKEFIDQQNPTVAGFHWQTAAHGFMYAFGQWTETQDGGLTWGPAHKLGLWANRVYPLCSYPDGSALLSVYYWNEQTKMTYISEDGNPDNQRDITFHDTWMEQATFTGKYVIGGDEGIMEGDCKISADSGKTWTTAPLNVQYVTFSAGAVCFGADTIVIAGENLSTVRSCDGGATWQASVYANGRGSEKMYCKNRNECFMLGTYGRLLRTDDGWDTWSHIDLRPLIKFNNYDQSLEDMEFPTPDTGYVSGDNFIYRTVDGGDHWTEFEHPTSGYYLMFPDKDTGYIAYTNMYPSVYQTFNAGETWSDFSVKSGYEKTGRSKILFRNAREGLTSEKDQLLFTKDAGKTWQTKAIDLQGTYLTQILYSRSGSWIIFGGGNLYKCDNDFNCQLKYQFSYTNVSVPTFIERDQGELHLCTGYSSVLYSNDDGNTWQSRKDTLFERALFADATVAYACEPALRKLYKRNYKSTIQISAFEQADSLSYRLRFTAQSPAAGQLILHNSAGDALTAVAVSAVSGKEYILQLPAMLPAGEGYFYEFVPDDTLAYNSVKSPEFAVVTTKVAINEIVPSLKYSIIDRVLTCTCRQALLYDILGRVLAGDLSKGIELKPGIYMLRCGTEQQRVEVY